MSDFKSFGEILFQAPPISPLIAEPAPPLPEPTVSGDPLCATRLAERLDCALARLLEEIAAEVLGRELALAPVEIDTIVARLRKRYGVLDGTIVTSHGDITLVCDAGEIDASLGRRLRAALGRAFE